MNLVKNCSHFKGNINTKQPVLSLFRPSNANASKNTQKTKKKLLGSEPKFDQEPIPLRNVGVKLFTLICKLHQFSDMEYSFLNNETV
jgi:hypothetical protein